MLFIEQKHRSALAAHEKPFLRFDNHELIIEEGMAFCIESCTYILNVSGFRYSDTVIITLEIYQLVIESLYETRNLLI